MTEIILGPPGTGKTTTLLNELEGELGRGVPPDRIGYVSFTTRAANEAINRACDKFNLERGQFPHFRTIHSMCFRQLGLTAGDVLERRRLQEFADVAGVRITGRFSEDGSFVGYEAGDRILFMHNLARVRCIPLRQLYDEDDDSLPWNIVERVSRTLDDFKAAKSLYDYTDMLAEFVRQGITLPLEVLFVDEAQDLSALQWQVVFQLAAKARRVVVAGDDDQAIYRWAGADVEQLITMEGDVRVLEQSWRVPPALQGLATSLTDRLKRRRPKVWHARKGSNGEVSRLPDFGEVDCSQGEILVLARNDYVLREFVEPELRRSGVIYEARGNSSVSASVLTDVLAWERLRKGGSVTVTNARAIYRRMLSGTGVKRGYKELPQFEDPDELVTLATLKEHGGLLTDAIWHEAMTRLPQDDIQYMIQALKRGEKLTAKPRVRLSTIHGAKGGEADHVVLMTEMAWRTYREMELVPDDEARVWYVAVTRAKERLSIIESTTPRACPWV